jgi:RNA polymerase sigma-70 factor (ECF subfamily)
LAEGPDRERIALDHALMRRIASGDEAAFGALVADETPRLLRFTRSLLPDAAAEAEEIVQESLLRLWQSAELWRPDGRVSTWLHQVAYRLSVDSMRRLRPAVAIESLEAELEDESPVAEARLIQIDDVNSVRAAIGELPARQRTALLLCHFQDMGQAEAAAVMGVGEHAYESLLARARRRMRSLLAGRDEEQGGGSHER